MSRRESEFAYWEMLAEGLRNYGMKRFASAYCLACAEDLGTGQVVCYQRTRAIGEVVGAE